MRIYVVLSLTVLFVALSLGCFNNGSGGPDGIFPDSEVTRIDEISSTSHNLWGMWQFISDPDNQSFEIVPLKSGDFHLNALHFLEPPPSVNLTVENVQYNGNIIDVDIGLRHPYLGTTQFTGFDVCGILITSGDISGFEDPDLVMPSFDNIRLLNPDGYSRWWNPAEFPHTDTIFGYKDGLLGTPDEVANFSCTLNGYKYFCDDLVEPDAPMTDVTHESRGMFSAGQKNLRHYAIQHEPGLLKFNYAVDASWKFPTGSPPWTAPDDFPPAANRPEAWRLSVTEISNSLWNDGDLSGGGLSLSIDVYDWFNAGLNTVKVESPGNFSPSISPTPIGGGEGYSTYSVDISNATPDPDSIELLISSESEKIGYGGLLPGKPVTAYFTHTVTVSGTAPEEWKLVLEDAVQIIDPVHSDWPQLDDFSPTIGESADESLLVIWYAVNDTNDIVGYYEGASNWGSVLCSFRSTDSGSSWNEGLQENLCVGAQLIIRDAIKSLPYISGSRMHAAWPGFPPSTSNSNYLSHMGTGDQHNVYWKDKADKNIEAVIMEDAKLIVFSDNGGEIEAQISIGNEWDDPSPFWYPPFSDHPTYFVDSGYLSSVRSSARDQDGLPWLFYCRGSDTLVIIGRAFADWGPIDPIIIMALDGAIYESVQNPSLFIDGNAKYITTTQKYLGIEKYEIAAINLDPPPTHSGVVAQSNEPINDAQIISGQTSGAHLIAVTYATGGGVYCKWSLNEGDFSGPVLISHAGIEGGMPDFIFDVLPSGSPDAYLHFVWCERDDEDDNWEVFYRRGYMQPPGG